MGKEGVSGFLGMVGGTAEKMVPSFGGGSGAAFAPFLVGVSMVGALCKDFFGGPKTVHSSNIVM